VRSPVAVAIAVSRHLPQVDAGVHEVDRLMPSHPDDAVTTGVGLPSVLGQGADPLRSSKLSLRRPPA
jgi:hypothetical protein